MAISRLRLVLNTLGPAIATALNNAGITTPNQVVVGEPNFEDLTKIIQQGQFMVTVNVDAKATKNVTRWAGKWGAYGTLSVPLTATVSGNVITFSGTLTPPLPAMNIHTIFGAPKVDALYQVGSSDTLNGIATATAAAINAKGVSGVTATPSGATVTVTGSPYLNCNVGASQQIARVIRRIKREMVVKVWASSDAQREAAWDAIESGVGFDAPGSPGKQFYPLGDGTSVWCRWSTSIHRDEQQQNYSMYLAHIFYTIEYGTLQFATATQIGAFQETDTINGTVLPTLIEG